MTEATGGDTHELKQGQIDSTETLDNLLTHYKDVVENFSDHALIANRFAEMPSVVSQLNSQLDRTTSAFYAESAQSKLYKFDPDTSRWSPLSDVYVQGPQRPFIGDELAILNDELLLIDRARDLGITNFVHLQIRPKGDSAVEEFSKEKRVDALRELGEAALAQDRPAIISRNRWGVTTETDPVVE
jgi:hypothetical protein